MTDVAAPSPIPSIHEPTASSSAPAALAQDGPTVQAMANGHTHQMASTKAAESLPNIGEMEARCGGCKGVIDQEGGGVVVAFGSSLWHVGCFRCAKCKEKVSADTNLLLLSDGSPVCGNCSYQCFVCKQAITEEAIMTGDESYHAHCFTCRTCKRRIEELVFAKTSQGIYCMGCHNERVAKQRRHVEQKRQRAARKEREREEREKDEERKRQTAGSASGAASDADRLGTNMASSSGTAGSSNHLRLASPIGFNVGPGSTATTPYTTPLTGTGNAVFPDASPVASSENGSSMPRSRDLSVDQQLNVSRSASPSNGGKRSGSPLPPLPQSPSDMTLNFSQAQVQARGPSPVIPGPGQSQAQSQSQTQSPALTNSPSSSSQKGGSNTGIGLGVGPVGLSVPTSKADKRRSINPGMSFNMDSSNSTYAYGAEPRLSPLPPSPLRASFTDAPRGSLDSRRPPPSPSTGAGAAGDSFPFRATDGQTGGSGPPPRKSSLDPSQLTNGPLGPRARGPSTAPVPYESRLGGGGGGTQPLNVKTKDKGSSGLSTTGGSGSNSTPEIGAPALPTMSFSLSDDFASILGGMDGTGSGTAGSGSTDRQLHAEPVSDESPPVSPLPGQSNSNMSTSMTRSPMVGSLSSVTLAAGMPPAGLGRSASPSSSRDRLEPGPSAPFLRSRQASAESTYSLSGRLGQDSAFGQVVSIVAEAKHNGKEKVEVDLGLLSGIVGEVEELRDALSGLKSKYTGVKRTSQQYSHGLTVAGEEYDREVALRRDLELENTRLRAQMHSQTARLSVISGDERKAETMRRRSHDLANSLTGLEREMSRLKAQRDMTLAEIEELQKRTNTSSSAEGGALQESLTSRLDTIKEQYREELEPLTAQREALQREIADLRETKEQYIEESTALSAKNDELAELNQSLSRQAESLQDILSRRNPLFSSSKGQRQHPSTSPSISSLATSATLHEVPEETARVVKVTKPEPQPIEAAPARRFKWYGYKSSKGPSAVTDAAGQGPGGGQGGGGGSGNNSGHSGISRPLAVISGGVSAVGTAAGLAVATAASAASGVVGGSSPGSNGLHVPGGNGAGGAQRPSTEMGLREHAFQQHSTMRLTRCELCGEKMWGLQEVKCAFCHAKCSEKLPRSCTGSKNSGMDMDGPLPPSMFGRDLSEQTSSDRAEVPVIVSKSIAAVEAVGMEYEGIYRKTGGSSQSKQITQLFERGDYDAFDLSDVEVFNDISSVTSVLKTYFRQLPNPLLTHELHESFVAASAIKELSNKQAAFTALLKELPRDHYNTLRALMLHLNRVMQASGSNLMTSQNLGVVFGPTLMRSSDPGREFADMGGKAMCVTWMVENAPNAFAEARS